jgi:hypothetical protein
MKLPDFFKSSPLNDLKRRMGLATDTYGSYLGDQERLTAAEQVLLESGEGIEVSFDQIRVLSDKTLAYKNSRVLLYIRDVNIYGGRKRNEWLPRYHLSHCSTLKEMTAEGRFDRYVVAAETEGEFELNMLSGGSRLRNERHRLPVCQNCLDGLAFQGFSLRQSKQARTEYVRSFTPASFFKVYPRSLHARKPRYTSATAPINTYTDDFSKISRRIREQVDWRCEGCRHSFAAEGFRRFLHVHHRNGNKRDNSPENLEVLCIICHAEQPRHGHLKSDPMYKKLLELQLEFS